ncbi:MAG: hypothetical protein U0838_01590 [Chloroflexota bacterium]
MTLAAVAPVEDRDFRPAGEGRYILELPRLALTLDLDRLRRDRGYLHGELIVRCGLPGTRSADGVLYAGDVNVSTPPGRDLVSLLSLRANVASLDWPELLGDLSARVLAAERHGAPAVLLRDVPRPGPDEDVVVDGVRVLLRHPMMLFGDGGVAKSLYTLYLSTRLEAMGIRVMYADWEFSGEDHRDRLERLCGAEMPAIRYVRCERPLVAEADRLRRLVREHGIDYLVCDSVAFASDGPPEAAEVAGAYFRSLRAIGVGSLNVAHTTKAEGGDQKPFGSTFWHNGSRSTWYVKRAAGEPGDARLGIALFNRKSNVGPLSPAVGFSIEFGAERTTFAREDVAGMGADVAAQLSVRQRMVSLLRTGAMTMVEIAGELDVPVDTIVKTSKRGDGKVFVRVPGADGVFRIGLLERSA